MQNNFLKLFKEFLYLIVIIGSFLLFAFALLSDFSYDIFYKGVYSEAFFDMWKRLTVGDVSISRDVLNGEIFIINGRLIPYYLPLPAAIRGFLSIFEIGEYPIPSILMAISLYSVSIYFLLKKILVFAECRERNTVLAVWYPFFLLPLVSLFVDASIYWEAIIWALALFITQGFLFISFLIDPKKVTKYSLLIVSGLILFTRPTYGIASVFLVAILFFLDLKSKNYSTQSIFPYFLFVVALLLLAFLNYQKWGNPFEFAPLAHHEQLIGNERGRMAAISPSLSINRIPETVGYYFLASNTNFSFHPPIINIGNYVKFFDWTYFDYKEGSYSITLILPFHVLGGLLGVFILFGWKKFNLNLKKIFQLYFFISVIPALLMLMMISMALRYRAEFYDFFLFSSMIGIINLQNAFSKKKILIIAFSVTLVAFALVFNGLFAERLTYFASGNGRNPQLVCAWFSVKAVKCGPYQFPFDDSFFLTDNHWVRGIARGWAGFFVPYTPKFYNEYKVGRIVKFANRETREIIRVKPNGLYLNIYLNGDPLDHEKVGLPTRFVVVDKAGHNPEEVKK